MHFCKNVLLVCVCMDVHGVFHVEARDLCPKSLPTLIYQAKISPLKPKFTGSASLAGYPVWVLSPPSLPPSLPSSHPPMLWDYRQLPQLHGSSAPPTELSSVPKQLFVFYIVWFGCGFCCYFGFGFGFSLYKHKLTLKIPL